MRIEGTLRRESYQWIATSGKDVATAGAAPNAVEKLAQIIAGRTFPEDAKLKFDHKISRRDFVITIEEVQDDQES